MTRTATGCALSGARRYVYDGQGRILGEYGASATDVITETLWLSPDAANDNQPFGGDDGISGYAPLAVSSAPAGGTAQIVWVHGSHMGVPLAYTNTTGAEITPPSFTQSAFPGQMRTLPDLYYNRYRDYDPTTGRYIQADPIGLAGDPNPYAYAMNNPLRYSDPMGLEIANQFPFNEPDTREGAHRAYDDLPQPVREGGFHIFGHGGPETLCQYVRKNCTPAEEYAKKLMGFRSPY